MDTLKIIKEKSGREGLPFLVMGGLAVSAHGYGRHTADIDLLAQSARREEWKKLMAGAGYQVFQEQGPFTQFSPVEAESWPVDIMFVNEETFAKMNAEGVEAVVQDTQLRIPSVEHLIALKLHALKNTNSRRGLKDLLDVASLVEANHIDLNGEVFKNLCERYGTPKIHAQIIAISAK
jgi:Uncharacterised nucleotidyltransferase